MLEAGADRAVQAELVTTLRNASAAELALFSRDESERESRAELLQSQLPN